MTGTMIEIDTGDGSAEAYVARPESGTGPGVLLFMDAIGLRPRLTEMADRIAGWGFVVLAPNVFYRDGTAAELGPTGDLREPGAREAFFGSVAPIMAAHTAERAGPDLVAYARTLTELADSGTVGFGTVGYCMGGRLALRAAAQLPQQVAAVAMFHPGGLVTDDPDSPHRVISSITAEVLARYADHDDSMPTEAIETVDDALRRAGVRFSTAVYPGAVHGFTMADTPMYSEAAAERHFTELREFLTRTVR